MAGQLPNKLKDMAGFVNGLGYMGRIASLSLPKLVRKFEDWRAAGMDSPLKIDMGGEALETEWSYGGPVREILGQYGTTTIDGISMRFVGAYQADDEEDMISVEVTMRGRHQEIDPGESKVGEGGDFKVKTALAYYKLDWNGETLIEIDPLNRVLIVNGNDLYAQRRNILGLN